MNISAWEQGNIAGLAGDSIEDDNPFEFGTLDWSEWNDGWEAGAKESYDDFLVDQHTTNLDFADWD